MAAAGVRDEQRDIKTLAWDLTVHQLREAFAKWAVPGPERSPERDDPSELDKVRLAAAWHVVEDMRASLRRMGSDDIDIVDVWGQDSFPASDPPANW